MPYRQDLEGGWHRDEQLARKTFHRIHQGLVDIDVQRAPFPVELGGLGISLSAREMIAEELARGDSGLTTHIGIILWTMMPAMIADRQDLLREFIPRICDDKPHGCCMALTEPSGGANMEDPSQHGRTIQTIAELDGDEWVINGHKIWPSGASIADITYCMVCTTDPKLGDDGIALIYIPPDAEGMTFSKPFKKMGVCYSDVNTEIYLENVRVPKRYRVSGPGEDAKITHDIIGIARGSGVSNALGVSQACFETVLEWTKNREIAGKPVRNRSLHAATLGEMAQKIDSGRAFSYQVSRMIRSGLYGRPGEPFLFSKCSAVRAYTSTVVNWVTSKAMELMGSYGYAFEYPIEKYLRDSKILSLTLGGPQRQILDTALGYYDFEW